MKKHVYHHPSRQNNTFRFKHFFGEQFELSPLNSYEEQIVYRFEEINLSNNNINMYEKQIKVNVNEQQQINNQEEYKISEKYLDNNLINYNVDDEDNEIEQDLFNTFNVNEWVFKIIIQLILCIYYMYLLSQLLFYVSQFNYTIYNVEYQIPLLILNIIFLYTNFKEKSLLKYLNLFILIPFICSFADNNNNAIILQLFHIVTLTHIFISMQNINLIFITFNCQLIYFIFERIVQIHFFQILCGFLIIITDQENSINNNLFYISYSSLPNILININQSLTFLNYLIKIIALIFLLYQFALIIIQFNNHKYKEYDPIKKVNSMQNQLQLFPVVLRYLFIKQIYFNNINLHNNQLFEIIHRKEKALNLFQLQFEKLIELLPILSRFLSNDTKSILLKNAVEIHFYESKEIIMEYDQCNNNQQLYYVIKGKVTCFQKRNQIKLKLGYNQNGIYNQHSFFLDEQTNFGIECDTSCLILSLKRNKFFNSLNQNEYQIIKQEIDKMIYLNQNDLLGFNLCCICQGNHAIGNCCKVFYQPFKQKVVQQCILNFYLENERNTNFIRKRQRQGYGHGTLLMLLTYYQAATKLRITYMDDDYDSQKDESYD